jgi:dTDP-glucose 4,6-dehydratase
MRLLLTGAGGFIGSHVLAHVLANTDWDVTATDSFRHKGKTDRIELVLASHPEEDRRSRVTVVHHDLAAPVSEQMAARFGHVDYLIAMASGSHVPRSIADPTGFIRNNVDVALSTLEFARAYRPEKTILISSDEVYGPADKGTAHLEWAPVIPSSPYSASKACQEAISIAYWRTYGLPVGIVNCANLVGEMQDQEKFLPTVLRKLVNGEMIGVHGEPGNIGTRFYQHPRNLADALVFLLQHVPLPGWSRGETRPERFNVVGLEEMSNLELAQEAARIAGLPLRYRLEPFPADRPGHDQRYGLDGSKLAALGWRQPVPFRTSLEHTVRWTLAHPEWLLP